MLFRALILSALLFPQAYATTFVETPFPDLIGEAPAVVRGTIGTSSSDWVLGEDGSKRIYTFYQLQVGEVFKGDVSGTNILVREMGGEKDGVGMQVAGAAQFARGEDVVLLLGEQDKDGSYEVRGLASGKFNLRRQENGAECLSGVGVTKAESDGFVHAEGEHGDTSRDCAWTLTALRRLTHSGGPSPKNSVKTTASPVASPLSGNAGPSAAASPPAAPQLQSSMFEERGSFGGRLWIAALGLGLLGLAATVWFRPKK